MNNQLRQVARSAQNDLGVWVRNATEKGRRRLFFSRKSFFFLGFS
jgi:hypothetical protein